MRRFKKVLALTLGAALVVSSFSEADTAQAAAKPKLSKTKLTIKVGKKATLTLKNVKKKQLKKVKWSINKKVAAITVKKKNVVTVKGKKAGKAKITAKLGKKKYTCTVTVKAAAKKTTKPTASASGGAVTASGSATTGSTATNAPAGNDPLLFTTAAPEPPANVQPAQRQSVAATETPVPLNTAVPGGDPAGEVGNVPEVRNPFTVPGYAEVGEEIYGGIHIIPTPTPEPEEPDPDATAVPTVRVSGCAYNSNGYSLANKTLYFYPGDSETYEATAYTDSDGDFSVNLKGSEFGTNYRVEAYISYDYRDMGTIFVTNEAETLSGVSLYSQTQNFPYDNYDNAYVYWTSWDTPVTLDISTGETDFVGVTVSPGETVTDLKLSAQLQTEGVRKIDYTIYDSKGYIIGNGSGSVENTDETDLSEDDVYDVTLRNVDLTGGNYYIRINPQEYTSYYDSWSDSYVGYYTTVYASIKLTCSKENSQTVKPATPSAIY